MKEGNNGNSNNSEKKKVEGAHRIVNVHKSQIGKSKNTDGKRNYRTANARATAKQESRMMNVPTPRKNPLRARGREEDKPVYSPEHFPLLTGTMEVSESKAKGRKPKHSFQGSVKVIPLGGLDQIGMNITAIETEDTMIIVDCGLAFPTDDMLGIDLVIPDISYIKSKIHKMKGFVITHGHEDHIGALPYVLQQINVPIYATKLTLALIQRKLVENGLDKLVKMKTMKFGQTVNFGDLKVEFVKTNHSIQDALNLVGLPYKDKKLFSQYSLGMKQRLAIALAVMHDPELLILDEPINGLDPIGIAEVRKFIRELCNKRGKTILLSSHILSEIALLADDIGIIDRGVLLEEETFAELEQKSSRHIHFTVSDSAQAAMVLEKTFKETHFLVHDDHNLNLYNLDLPVGKIVAAYVETGLEVSEAHTCEETLEDYFKRVTGGEGIA